MITINITSNDNSRMQQICQRLLSENTEEVTHHLQSDQIKIQSLGTADNQAITCAITANNSLEASFVLFVLIYDEYFQKNQPVDFNKIQQFQSFAEQLPMPSNLKERRDFIALQQACQFPNKITCQQSNDDFIENLTSQQEQDTLMRLTQLSELEKFEKVLLIVEAALQEHQLKCQNRYTLFNMIDRNGNQAEIKQIQTIITTCKEQLYKSACEINQVKTGFIRSVVAYRDLIAQRHEDNALLGITQSNVVIALDQAFATCIKGGLITDTDFPAKMSCHV